MPTGRSLGVSSSLSSWTGAIRPASPATDSICFGPSRSRGSSRARVAGLATNEEPALGAGGFRFDRIASGKAASTRMAACLASAQREAVASGDEMLVGAAKEVSGDGLVANASASSRRPTSRGSARRLFWVSSIPQLWNRLRKTPEFPRRHQPLAVAEMRLGGRRKYSWAQHRTRRWRSPRGRARAPCLFSCRTEDAWLSPDNSRYLAEQIPGAQLLELLSVDHDPWVGALNDVLAALEGFVSAIGRDRLEPALPA